MAMGGTALILLPLLISGYLFNLVFYPLRYFSGRAEGQRLFFMAAGSGLILTVLTFGLIDLLSDHLGERSDLLARLMAATNRTAPIPDAFRSTLTVLASVASAFCLNGILLVVHRKRPQSTAKCVYNWLTVRFGSNLAQLLRRAAEEQRFVMLTLKSRKIYCGHVREAPTDTDKEDVQIEIVPLFSSYRDKDTLRMGERTEYPLIDLWAARRYLESRIDERDLFERKAKSLGFDASQPLIKQELDKLDAKIESATQALAKFGDVGDIRAEDWIKTIPIREIESASFYDPDANQAWFSGPRSPTQAMAHANEAT